MRIREIVFKDFRCFRGERRISFVDPATDTVRPVTVLAGSNGSGKTTLLDSIEALLAFFLDPHSPRDLVYETQWSGSIGLVVEFFPDDLPPSDRPSGVFDGRKPEVVTIFAGRKDLALDYEQSRAVGSFVREEAPEGNWIATQYESSLAQALRRAVSREHRKEAAMGGGLLYFPHDRRLAVTRGGPIESPPEKREWLFRFSPSDKWQGSLEHLWVWQNYLDLEADLQERQNLDPFVESVETVLGQDRRITISKGRVQVPVGWGQEGERPRVRLDQLPSGEQQVLLLFGELARRRRRGAVIMIDEIENSLHPTLQRLVMWNLHRIAREWDAQVIVATHSLEVINTVRGGAFINLDYPEDRFDLPVTEQDEEQAP
jgi:energy-coupling factor transporter ATP-binding protein EcfA2